MATRTQMKDLMKRLHSVYEETGGQRLQVQEEFDYRQTVNGFDALLVLVAKKLQLIRERINSRDEAIMSHHGGRKKGSKRDRGDAERRIIQLSNDVRKMVSFVRADVRKLVNMHERGLKRSKFSIGKKFDPNVLAQQAENLKLLERHVQEVEALSRRRIDEINGGSGTTGGVAEEKSRSILFSGPADGKDDDKLYGGGNKDNPLSSLLIREDELPMDARDSNLPQLDIQEMMHKVQDYKQQIDQGLDTFAKKLVQLHEMSKDIGHELDEQNVIISDIDNKVERETEKIVNLNARVQKATAETTNTMRLMILAAILLIIAILVIAGGVYLMATFRPLSVDLLF